MTSKNPKKFNIKPIVFKTCRITKIEKPTRFAGNVNAVTFHTQHHVLLPSSTQTLNRHMYRFNPNAATVMPAPATAIITTAAVASTNSAATPPPPLALAPSIGSSTDVIGIIANANGSTNNSNTTTTTNNEVNLKCVDGGKSIGAPIGLVTMATSATLQRTDDTAKYLYG